MTDWRDDPEARAAIERAKAIMAVFAQAQAVSPRAGASSQGASPFQQGGLAAHVDGLFRAGWRYLLVCSGPGPVPPRFGEENQRPTRQTLGFG